MRIFLPSAAHFVTDHAAVGEGLLAWNIVNGMAERGHDVVACANDTMLSAESRATIVTVEDGTRWESLFPFTRPAAVKRVLMAHGGAETFDAIHWLFPQDPDFVWLPTGAQRTVIGPLPRPWPTSDRSEPRPGDVIRGALRPLLRRRYARALGRVDVLLSSLPEVTEQLSPELRSKVVTLGFGVDTDRFRPAPFPSTPTVLFAGRLIENKRVLLLVDAFAQIAPTLQGARLVIAGDGPLRPKLEQSIARSPLEDRVALLGDVEHQRMPQLLRDASILCLPSAGEPYGMVVLEAMASGRAVVATDSPGPRFLLDDPLGGALVPRDDVGALAAALERLLVDPDGLVRIGRHNRAQVEQKHALPAVLDRLEAVYAGRITRDPDVPLGTDGHASGGRALGAQRHTLPGTGRELVSERPLLPR